MNRAAAYDRARMAYDDEPFPSLRDRAAADGLAHEHSATAANQNRPPNHKTAALWAAEHSWCFRPPMEAALALLSCGRR